MMSEAYKELLAMLQEHPMASGRELGQLAGPTQEGHNWKWARLVIDPGYVPVVGEAVG